MRYLILVGATLLFSNGAVSQQTVSVMVKTRGALDAATQAAIAAYGSQVTQVLPQIRAMAMDMPSTGVPALSADPRVAVVEMDHEFERPTVRAADLTAAFAGGTPSLYPWNQDQVDTLDSGLDGRGVTVVVIDSGLPQNWRDSLPAGIRMNLEYAASFAPEGNGRRRPAVGPRVGPTAPISLDPHGYGVMSVISGYHHVVGGDLVAGGAPGATFLPIQVFNQFDRGLYSWMAGAFVYAAELKRTGVLQGPVVVNLSGGGRNFSQVLDDAVDYLLAQGVLCVVAAGNEGDEGLRFPGRKPEVITAAAAGFVGEFGTPRWYWEDVPEGNPLDHYVAFFSAREPVGVPPGSQIDVLGPGDFVIAAWGFGNGRTHAGFSDGHNDNFRLGSAFLSGTSFAAPHVTAVVAQMLQRNPSLTQAQVEGILRRTALPIPPNPTGVTTAAQVVPPWGANATGAGLLRGGAAVAGTPQ